jgi:hypothetical protein
MALIIKTDELPIINDLTDAKIIGLDKNGVDARFKLSDIKGDYKGLAAAATVPGVPVLAQYYDAEPGVTYTNFLGANNNPIVIPTVADGKTVLGASLIWQGSYWLPVLKSIIPPVANIASWTTIPFNIGSQVNFNGKDWVAIQNTLATDVPGSSNKWVTRLDFNTKNEVAALVGELAQSIINVSDEEKFIIHDSQNNVGLQFDDNGLTVGSLGLTAANATFIEDSEWIWAVEDMAGQIAYGVNKDFELLIKTVKVQNVISNTLTVSGAANIPALGLGAGRYPSSKWSGKKILWLGTSIPKFSGYPEAACAQNNATCINNAVGGAAIRAARPDGTFANVFWQNYAYALSHTIAEKQAIITNWATIAPQLQSAPATLSSAEQTNILNSSYENLLMPWLDGRQAAPDAIVLDHGYNDWANFQSGDAFTTVPSTRTNRNTFIGANNYLIDLILQYKRRMRIIIGGHYENTGAVNIALGQTTLANYWEFPILKLWEKTGWSQQKILGTASLWAQEPWLSNKGSADTTQDMTARRYNLPDDLHPHKDTSNNAQTLLADIWGNFLNNTF